MQNILSKSTHWGDKLISLENGQIEMLLEKSEIASFNVFLVENGIPITEIISRKKLEDYFLKLTSQNNN
jgi:hypothetical protein